MIGGVETEDDGGDEVVAGLADGTEFAGVDAALAAAAAAAVA